MAAVAAVVVAACDSGTASGASPGAQGPAVTVTPTGVTLEPGGGQTFAAVVTGTADLRVVWSVQEAGGGIISPAGVPTTASATYTAPGAFGTYHVVATSAALPAVSGSATVNVALVGETGDVPAWIAALPTLGNGMKWMPGIPGGIPAGTPDTTLTAGQMTAAGINSAIAAASSRGSATNIRVVQMPAGTFSIGGTITPQSYVILRGAGPGAGGTQLRFTGGNGVFNGWASWPGSATNITNGPLPVGTSQIVVASGTPFSVGDVIQLDQIDDPSYVWIYDAAYYKRAPGWGDHGPVSAGGFRSVASLHQVTAKSGTTLTIDPPTRILYDRTPQAWLVARQGYNNDLWWFGLEDAYLTGGTGDTGQITYNAAVYSWVKNVETDGTNTTGSGIGGGHINLEHSFRCEIRRVYSHHEPVMIQGGGAYGINLEDSTSESLVIDSIVVHHNKCLQTNVSGGGNVFAYNYVDNPHSGSANWQDGAANGSHQSFTHHDLWEGNYASNIGTDTTHGNSGFLTYFRNYSPGRSGDATLFANQTTNVRAFNVDGWMRETAAIGNVFMSPVVGGHASVYEVSNASSGSTPWNAVWRLGQNSNGGSGDDYDGNRTTPEVNSGPCAGAPNATFTTKAKDKLWRHGNWDQVTNGVVWDPGFPTHSIPASLFLTAAPGFFGAYAWPPVNPTGATASARYSGLPAKIRYDAGSPFTP